MKKNNFWKRFWNLNVHNHEGFTLVELIIVIAILAILSGVAVVGYSSYVTKANKQADLTLVAEIENALTLAFYSGDLPEGSAGYIVLSPNNGESMVDEGGFTASALESAFGSNWENAMQLKYKDWGVKSMTLSYAEAQAVVNSHFVQKYSQEELMLQVQAMTNAVNGLQLQIGDTEVKLYDMYGYEDDDGNWQNAIIDTMKEYGLGETEEAWNALSSTEKSNLLVLATAASISKGHTSSVTTVMPDYALYTAFAAENAAFNEDYKAFQEAINNVDPNSADSQYTQIKAAYNTLKSAANAKGFEDWKATHGKQNTDAFNAIMAGVGNAMKDNGDAILGDLGNADMFTTGIGSELYGDYLDSAYASAGAAGDDSALGGGKYSGSEFIMEDYITIWFSVVNGNIYIDNSLPTNS